MPPVALFVNVFLTQDTSEDEHQFLKRPRDASNGLVEERSGPRTYCLEDLPIRCRRADVWWPGIDPTKPASPAGRAVARIRALRDQGYGHLDDAGVKAYFDAVHFPVLESQLAARGEPPWILQLVAEWNRCPAWDGHRLRARTKGRPQNSPPSPSLANLYLMPLDTALSARNWKLVRYADDFVVLTPTPNEAKEALALIQTQLAALRLELHPEKTRLTSFDEAWRFLGVFFQKDEIRTPWNGQREPGRPVAIAPPMPPPPSPASAHPARPASWKLALRQAGARHLPTRTHSPEARWPTGAALSE